MDILQILKVKVIIRDYYGQLHPNKIINFAKHLFLKEYNLAKTVIRRNRTMKNITKKFKTEKNEQIHKHN